VQLRGRGAPGEILQAACQVNGTAPDLAADQLANAQAIAIASVGLGLGLGDKDVLVGIVVAITESTLHNVDHGDNLGIG
jgi:hypothetical protein